MDKILRLLKQLSEISLGHLAMILAIISVCLVWYK